jgi:hypothetical protein
MKDEESEALPSFILPSSFILGFADIPQEVLAMDWLPTLPDGFHAAMGRYALLAAFAGAAAGAILWLAGSRFSRPLVTLLAVSLGAVLGVQLPARFCWSVDPIGVAFVGAMVLGVSGYLLHTTWIGLSLSLTLATWVGVAAWLTVGGGAQLQWPVVSFSGSAEAMLANVWRSLPGDLPRVMPVALAGALISGVAITVLSPRLGRVLTYSLVGLSLVLVMGVTAVRMSRPDLLAVLPRSLATQAAALAGMVMIGVLTQWRLTPAGSGASTGGEAKE